MTHGATGPAAQPRSHHTEHFDLTTYVVSRLGSGAAAVQWLVHTVASQLV